MLLLQAEWLCRAQRAARPFVSHRRTKCVSSLRTVCPVRLCPSSCLSRCSRTATRPDVPCGLALPVLSCPTLPGGLQGEKDMEEEEEEEEEGEGDEGDDDEEDEEQGGSEDSDGLLDGVESDDGDGGQINLSLDADLPANLSRQNGPRQAGPARQIQGLNMSAGGAGGRGLKRLVPDKEQDDIMSEIFRELVPRKRRRRRKRKVMARGGLVLPPDVELLLGQANTEYAYGNFDQAREKLKEVIRICPSCPDAYTTLGLIHEERQEAGKALDFLIIAAHLTPKDAEMWSDLAQRSRAQGKLKQAIYCLNRAVKLEPNVDELLWDKAVLLQVKIGVKLSLEKHRE